VVLKALAVPREKPLRILIDALDEAQKPDGLDRELLRPLAELPAVRLIVGSRCPRKDRPPLGERAEVLDLDAPQYFDEADIAEYVIQRLQRRDSATPYTPSARVRLRRSRAPLRTRPRSHSCSPGW
jgi:hypothetical protein